ncbi:hypothetical protein V1951_18240, partial [Yersinia sp. 2544 StPb PI]|uniref:hypothetical protein n=1 Tax=Yersinia sp. 2544 StPb PI TaxID=3117409 RepID=UPI003B282F9F
MATQPVSTAKKTKRCCGFATVAFTFSPISQQNLPLKYLLSPSFTLSLSILHIFYFFLNTP